MERIYSTSRTGTAVQRSSANRWLALAGIVGPIVWTLIIALLDVLQYDWLIAHNADPLSLSPVSDNSEGPYGWLMTINFAVYGLLVIAFAVGLHRGVKAGKWSKVGIGFLIAYGTAMLLGAFPPSSGPHLAGFFLSLLTLPPAFLFMWRRFRKDPRWHGYDWYSLATGLLALPLFQICGAEGAALQHSDGFYVWYLAVPLAWLVVVALRLRVLFRASTDTLAADTIT